MRQGLRIARQVVFTGIAGRSVILERTDSMIVSSPEHIAAVDRQRRVIVNFDTLAPILSLHDASLDELLDLTFGLLGSA